MTQTANRSLAVPVQRPRIGIHTPEKQSPAHATIRPLAKAATKELCDTFEAYQAVAYVHPTMRTSMNDDEANAAGWEAVRGAVYGATKYGVAMALLGGIGQAMSPIYRGLTIQFKVYIQMSGMVLGSMLEADSRLRMYEANVRHQRRIARHNARLRALEEEDDEK
ncbi:uncharacterized protein SPSK_04593 [Sporothrix schenckii 1099-18]|uniref:Uncharacterized protein n=2 Tax=Sporothrix schenckii TaxID=29908 RepID=U7PMP9_SPOS1|nr:uncharacterized protein SPSK_04593 [Sporothrix schenckii 1099-18]ERS95790.1 hypothetical protein HMPREF1624_07865 [Sporothrix schenckii ATCC 58251]KJR83811.1 hypothetical protein SPSK_04593 [Sporothrix schenckii 1099-18]